MYIYYTHIYYIYIQHTHHTHNTQESIHTKKKKEEGAAVAVHKQYVHMIRVTLLDTYMHNKHTHTHIYRVVEWLQLQLCSWWYVVSAVSGV